MKIIHTLEELSAWNNLPELEKCLVTLTQLFAKISWDQNEPKLVRNQFGYINRSKKARAKVQIFGLHWEKLSCPVFTGTLLESKLFQQAKKDLQLSLIEVREFITSILKNQPSRKINSLRMAQDLVVFMSYRNDLTIIGELISEFIFFEKASLNTTSAVDRYYFANFLVKVGESAKNLSYLVKQDTSFFNNTTNKLKEETIRKKFNPLTKTLKSLGKLRDKVKIDPRLFIEENSTEFQELVQLFSKEAGFFIQLFDALKNAFTYKLKTGEILKT